MREIRSFRVVVDREEASDDSDVGCLIVGDKSMDWRYIRT
jgi:hypothetical protein